jgi:hypothetical protein
MHLLNNTGNVKNKMSTEKAESKPQMRLHTPTRDGAEGNTGSQDNFLSIIKLSHTHDQHNADAQNGIRPLSARRVYVTINFLCVILGTSWLSYETIVQAEMLTNNVAMFLLFYAYVYLKLYNDGRPRPFQVPGGLYGASIAVFLPIIVILLYGYVSVTESDGRFLRLTLFFSIQAFGLLVHIVWDGFSGYLFNDLPKRTNDKNYSSFGDKPTSNNYDNTVHKVKYKTHGVPAVIIDDQETSISRADNIESMDPLPNQDDAKSELLSSVHGSKGL